MDIVSHFELIRLNRLITELNDLSNLADYRQIRRNILLRMDEIVLHEPSKFLTEVSLCICRYFLNCVFTDM